jgi:hypothetical protein
MAAESPQEHFEQVEHAEHAAHTGTPFLLIVSVTIAILAVVAATIGSFETMETAAMLTDQNAAALLQNKTSDQWAFFQAKSVKRTNYDIASKQGGPNAAEFAAQAKRYDDESKEIQKNAQGLEHQVEERLHSSEKHEHRHHLLTLAETLLHVAIAITTIAIITRGHRWPWLFGIFLSILGVFLAGYAFL